MKTAFKFSHCTSIIMQSERNTIQTNTKTTGQIYQRTTEFNAKWPMKVIQGHVFWS